MAGMISKFIRGASLGAGQGYFEQHKADLLAARDRRLAELKSKYPGTGTYNPRDYTPESWAKFSQSKDPSELKRYEAAQHVMIGDVPHVFDKVKQAYVPAKVVSEDGAGEAITAETVAGSKATVAGAEEEAKQQQKQKYEPTTAGMKKTAETKGKTVEERRATRIELGEDAAAGIPTVRRALDLLDKVRTGGVNAISLRVKQLLGAESADEGELSNKLSKAVLSQLRSTFGAAFTEKEGERLERIEAGFGKNTETNKRLLNEILQVSERAAKRAIKEARAIGDTDTADSIQDMMDFEFDENRDIFSSPATNDANQSPAAPSGGAAPTNKKYESMSIEEKIKFMEKKTGIK